MFEDLIKMLLEKKEQVNATLVKIDKLLAECGYVEENPAEEKPAEETNVEVVETEQVASL